MDTKEDILKSSVTAQSFNGQGFMMSCDTRTLDFFIGYCVCGRMRAYKMLRCSVLVSRSGKWVGYMGAEA